MGDFDFASPTIRSFFGANRFLSNFYAAEVEFEGLVYPTVEHAYQAAKSTEPDIREWIRSQFRAGDAKTIGQHSIVIRPDWTDELRLKVMTELVAKKFAHPHLAKMLLATGDADIVEGNNWHDTFFGVCVCAKHNGEGHNHLGKILMAVRATLREAAAPTP